MWIISLGSSVLLYIDDLLVGASLTEGHAKGFRQRGLFQGYYTAVDFRFHHKRVVICRHEGVIPLPAQVFQPVQWFSRHVFIEHLVVDIFHRLICGLLQRKNLNR